MGLETAGNFDNDSTNDSFIDITHLQADSIDGVIASLDKIVEWSKTNGKRTGYFAALYRKVTKRIKQGIEQNEFENNDRMEKLDVIFANRYLAAFERYYTLQTTTQSWDLAFNICDKWEPIVLMHLMLGMNAHINLDLGIAAAETVSAEELPELKNDFDKINSVLADLVDEIQSELTEIWPLFKYVDKYAGRLDEKFADFGMKVARDQAWNLAEEYSRCSNEDQQKLIDKTDCKVYLMGKLASSPNMRLRLLLLIVRLGERQNIEKVISILE